MSVNPDAVHLDSMVETPGQSRSHAYTHTEKSILNKDNCLPGEALQEVSGNFFDSESVLSISLIP